MKINLFRRSDPEPSTRAEIEAQRIVRAQRLGREAFEDAVGNLRFRCRLADDHELLGAAMAALHERDTLAAREARALIEHADREVAR